MLWRNQQAIIALEQITAAANTKWIQMGELLIGERFYPTKICNELHNLSTAIIQRDLLHISTRTAKKSND
jgi:hypothetical protein